MVADTALAQYDRDRIESSVFFGVKEYEAKRALIPMCPDNGRSRLEMTDELKDGSAVKNAIARHMTWRTATSILTDALDKWARSKRSGEVNVAQLSDYFPRCLVGYEVVIPTLLLMRSLNGNEYEELMDKEIRRVYQQGLTYCRPS